MLSFRRAQRSDFMEGGPLAGIEIPFNLPIPEAIMHHIYGENYGDIFQFSKQAEVRYLEYLHWTVNKEIVNICNNGKHQLTEAKSECECDCQIQ